MARPTIKNPRTKVVLVRLNEDEYAAVKLRAEETGSKVATAIYELLQESSLPERTRAYRVSRSDNIPTVT